MLTNGTQMNRGTWLPPLLKDIAVALREERMKCWQSVHAGLKTPGSSNVWTVLDFLFDHAELEKALPRVAFSAVVVWSGISAYS